LNNPKFKLFSRKGNKFYFRLHATNGLIILQSEAYNSKVACQNGVASVKKNAADLKNFEVIKSDKGIYFKLLAGNKESIGRSEPYTRMESCKQGITSVQKNSKSGIEDLTKA